MKLKAIRLLLLPTAVVLLVACGGAAKPEVDIEATVEARLIEERAAEATIEAKVQNIVEATPEAKYVIGDPLFLTLDSPASLELVIKEPSLVVRGKTRMDALLTVGSDVVEPNLDGGFSHTITLEPGHNIVEILASTSSGEKNSLILAVIYSP
jgi:hypothetical protein